MTRSIFEQDNKVTWGLLLGNSSQAWGSTEESMKVLFENFNKWAMEAASWAPLKMCADISVANGR